MEAAGDLLNGRSRRLVSVRPQFTDDCCAATALSQLLSSLLRLASPVHLEILQLKLHFVRY